MNYPSWIQQEYFWYIVKNHLNDQYLQKWSSDLTKSSKMRSYRIYKPTLRSGEFTLPRCSAFNRAPQRHSSAAKRRACARNQSKFASMRSYLDPSTYVHIQQPWFISMRACTCTCANVNLTTPKGRAKRKSDVLAGWYYTSLV